MAGEYITIASKDGGRFRAYLSLPPRGKGPGIVLCHEIFGANATMREVADVYACEGYVVAVPDLYWREEPGLEFEYTTGDWQRAFALSQSYDYDLGVDDVAATLTALCERGDVHSESTAAVAAQNQSKRVDVGDDESPAGPVSKHPPSGIAVLGFSLGGRLAYLAGCRLPDVSCAVSFYGTGIEDMLDEAKSLSGRLVIHLPDKDKFVSADARRRIVEHFEGVKNVEVYVYPGADRGFSRRGSETYNRPSSYIAHQRTMAALKREMGPYFNLSRLWDAHCRSCFDTRDVNQIMAGMVDDPYVNHVPTSTGGDGAEKVREFYTRHFIASMPDDIRIVPISRTVGASQLVDEVLLCFTHTCQIDWLLPCVPASKRYVEIPMVAIVNFRGDKVFRQQIYWDQASLLVQVGRLSPDSLPVAGIETARKIVNDDLPSNELIARG